MAIPSTTVDAALSIVSTLAKLHGRIDKVLAEKEALRADLALPTFSVKITTDAVAWRDELTTLLQETRPTPSSVSDPLGDDRQKIEDALKEADSPAKLRALKAFMLQYRPEKLTTVFVNPDADLNKKLQAKATDLDLNPEDINRLVLYLDAGEDLRKTNTTWQLVTNVVNVLAEVTVENQSLLIKDTRARHVVGAVLGRFADENLLQVGSGRQLLGFALNATINGALDAREALDGNKAWLEAVLSALATARTNSTQGDDFVFGLLHGRGYKTLVGALLREGAAALSKDDAAAFEQVAADVLTRAATVVQDSQDSSFEAFFQDHWSDLLRAGLQAAQTHGPAILAGTDPLLQKTLLAVVDSLAASTDRAFLSSDTFVSAVEAAIGAVAANPALLDETGFPDWVNDVLGSVAAVISQDGVKEAFSAAGLQRLVQGAFGTLAQHPELLGQQPKAVVDLVGSVLKALSEAKGLQLEDLAQAGVQGALEAVSQNPALLGAGFGPVVAGLAGTLAAQVKARSITALNAREILTAAIEALATNPALLQKAEGTALSPLVTFVENLTGGDLTTLLQGVSLNAVVRAALETVAENPGLLGTDFGRAIADLAGELADKVQNQALGGVRLQDLLVMVVRVIAQNPKVLATTDKIVAKAVGVVLKTLEELNALEADRLIQGRHFADLVKGVLAFLARYGEGIAPVMGGTDGLLERLQAMLKTALERALQDLGQRLNLEEVITVVLAFLEKWANGQVPTDITSEAFQTFFIQIVNAVQARLA